MPMVIGDMRRCIYCLVEKDESSFHGREHVIPQAFGLFDGNNLVLKCVCDDCNKFFGDGIDLKLARDSVEAIERINVGLKSAADFKSLGPKSTSHVEIKEGPLAGALGFNAANPEGVELRILPFPQVSFAKAADGPFHWFRTHQLPTKDDLVALGFERGCTLHIGGQDIGDEEVCELLTAKGFDLSTFTHVGESPSPNGRVYAETVAKVSHPEFRAVTKISLNYLAAVVGSKVALMPAFDAAREYARYGEQRAKVNVRPFENPWFIGRKGHYISITRSDDLIVAQLSLLLRIQFFVALATGDDTVPLISTAHFFDLTTNKLIEIEPLPIRRGRPLRPFPSAGSATSEK